MSNRSNPLSKIKLVYRPGKTITKVALLGVIVLSTVALITIHSAISSNEKRLESNRSQAIGLEQENSDLERKKNELGSKDSVIEIAEEELGLVDKDTVILDINNQ